jgi:uncharacterized protein (UPF0332 family)
LKPESALFLEKSRELLQQAEAMLGIHLNEAAGRTAYLAGFHAAQAVLFETHGRIFKTHSSVQGEFGRLMKDEPRFDASLRTFLPNSYNLKAIADYETGPGSRVSADSACAALLTARQFVDCVASLLLANNGEKRPGSTLPKPEGS